MPINFRFSDKALSANGGLTLFQQKLSRPLFEDAKWEYHAFLTNINSQSEMTNDDVILFTVAVGTLRTTSEN